jgi:outer membrane protein assembly complex protein YaeT
MFRSKLRLMLLLAGIAGLVIIFAVLALHSPPAQRYALRQIQSYLRDAHLDLDARSLSYNLLRGSVTLSDFRLTNPDARDLGPFLEARRAHVEVGLLSLLRGFLHIQDAVVEDARIRWITDEQGRSNLPEVSEQEIEEEEGGLPEFLVSRLQINPLAFWLEDRREGMRLDLPDLQLNVSGQPDFLHNIGLQAGSPGTVVYRGESLPVRRLGIRLALPGNLTGFTVEQADLQAGGSTLQLSGRLDDFTDPQLDVTVSANLNLPELAPLAGLDRDVAGRSASAFRISGPLPELVVAGEIEGEELGLDGFRDALAKIVFEWRRADERVRISSLYVQSPQGSLQGEADLALTEPAGRSRAQLQFRNANLPFILNQAGVEFVVFSLADGSAQAEWRALAVESARGSIDVTLSRLSERAGRNWIPASGRISGRLQAERADVTVSELRVPGLVLSGVANLTSLRDLTTEPKGDLDGRISGSVTDIQALLSSAAALAGNQELLPSDLTVSGGAELVAGLDGTLNNPIVTLDLEAPSIRVGDVEDIRFSVEARATTEAIELRRAAADWHGQSVTAHGRADLTQPSVGLDFQAEARALSVSDLTEAFNRDLPVSGKFDLQATASGTAEDPKVNTEIVGEELAAYGEQFGTLAAKVRLENRQVELDELRMLKPGSESGHSGELTASGSYHLDTGAYRVAFDGRDFEITQMVLPGDIPIRGRLVMAGTGSGTADDPVLNLTIEAHDLTVREIGAGTITARADVRDRQAELEFAAPQFNLTAEGRMAIDAPYLAELELRAANTSLAALPVSIGETPLEGRVSAVVRAHGSLQEPRDAEAQATIPNLSVQVAGQQIENQTPIDLSYSNRRLRIAPATIASDASYLTITGDLPLEPAAPPGSMDLEGSLDLARVMSAAELLPPGYALSGTMDIAGRITGSLERLEPVLNVSLLNGEVRVPELVDPVDHLVLEAGLQDGSIRIARINARVGQGQLEARGVVPLGMLPGELPFGLEQAPGPGELQASLRSFSLRSLQGVPEDMSGRLSVSLEAQAPRADLNAVTGSVRLDEMAIQVAQISMNQRDPGLITVQDGVVRIERFALMGPGTRVEAGGTASLPEPGLLDVRLSGNMDASLFAAFVPDVQAAGQSEFRLAVSGSRSNPQIGGSFSLQQGQIVLPDPPIRLSDLNVRLGLEGNRVVVQQFEGDLNGGSLTVAGEVGYEQGIPNRADLRVEARNVYLEYPEGLQTASNANLQVRSQNGPIEVGGRIDLLQGTYRRPVNLEEELLGLVGSAAERQGTTDEQDPLLARVRFNIEVRSQEPVLIDNNLVEIAAEMNVRLVGTFYSPSLLGRITLEEGGELNLRERTYYIERGVLSFNNPLEIEPSLDISARTEVATYEITLGISGTPDDLETRLTSDPELPEPDIVAILITGRSLEEARGQASAVVREQTLSLLAGTVAGRLERGLEGATGLTQVRIEPSLIAAESDPTARLTVGQDITRRLGLVYSMNLADSGDQIYVAEYDVTRRFTTRAIHETAPRGDSETGAKYRFELRHDLRLGGASTGEPDRAPRMERREVRNLIWSGSFPFTEAQLAERFGIRSGDRYDFFKVRRGLDRLDNFFFERDHLEATVRLNRVDVATGVVDVRLHVEAGPTVQLNYQGAEVSRGVHASVRRSWASGVFDTQRVTAAQAIIRESMVENGYLEARSQAAVNEGEIRKEVVFSVEPGTRYEDVQVEFRGASQLTEGQLRRQLQAADLLNRELTSGRAVRESLERLYRQEGFLEATVDEPVAEFDRDAAGARIIIPVREGPRAVVAAVEFAGNQVLADSELRQAAGLREGDTYRPELRESALANVRSSYARAGFNDAVITAAVDVAVETGRAVLRFNIEENRKEVVREITIVGNDKTSERFIRNQLAFSVDDVLTPDKISRSRRELYNTGAFTLVDMQAEEMEPSTDVSPVEKPVTIAVRVREVRPYRLQYGGSYDTDRGMGAIADLTNRNTVANAAVIGVRARYDSDFREGRVYYSQPQFAGLPFDTNLAVFAIREQRRNVGFIADRLGLSLQQQAEWRNKFVFSYGYRFERDHIFDTGPDAFFDETLSVGRLFTGLVRDLRNDVLDASRGSFTSHNLEYAPAWVGSDLTFMRYFGQYFQYVPLGQPREVPWSGGLVRPRFVYAGALRLGLGRAFGEQSLVPSERFFAGGGTTIRGFEQDTIGPRNIIGEPSGGEAVLILNNELRFPVYSIFDGVTFLDVGNIYRFLSDFDPLDLRKTAGVGLRIRTPYFLLRGDYGFKLDRREGESRGEFFFSIGQAF